MSAATAAPDPPSPSRIPVPDEARETDVALAAQSEYEKGNADEALNLLRRLPDSRSLTLNRLLCEFAMDRDCDRFLTALTGVQELEPDQQVLVDYNRALVLAKHQRRLQEAINLLEERRSLISESGATIDDKLDVQMHLLLAALYLDTRKNPSAALTVLQYVSEKCDTTCQPAPQRLQQLKAKCYLQMGSPKTAKRELKMVSCEPLIRCYLELQRGNCKKAMKIFNTNTGEDQSVMHRNNEALILFGLGKRNTAAFHLAKVLPEENSPEILYNLALVHLFTGNTKNGRRIFEYLIQFYKHNPRLWFRLAECCLQDQTSSFFRDIEVARQRHELLKGFGEGSSKKLILKASESKGHDVESMCFARGCLMNALSVLKSADASFFPSNVMPDAELARFKIALFLSLSFTNLCLHDYSPAFTYAKCALHLQPKGYQKVLGNMYAGEALISLDRMADAIPHFNPSLTNEEAAVSGDEATAVPDFICNWYPNTGRVILIYNQAVCHSMRGDCDKAIETLRQIGSSASQPDTVIPLQVINMVAYLQSQQGNVEGIKSLFRQHLSHYR